MSQDYIANVIRFLEMHRESFFIASMWRAVVQTIGDRLLFDEIGGEVLAAAAGGPTWLDVTPEAWLEASPLTRALRRRAGGTACAD